MNLLSQTLWFQKVRIWIDGIWALASLTCVPALGAISLYWAVGSTGLAQITKHSPVNEVHTLAGSTAQLFNHISVETPMELMSYKLVLVDPITHNRVFTYPEVKETKDQELGNVLLQLPEHLSPGTYALYADISYPSNPLKYAELKVKIADITIDKE